MKNVNKVRGKMFYSKQGKPDISGGNSINLSSVVVVGVSAANKK
jgi:hypothetical protein